MLMTSEPMDGEASARLTVSSGFRTLTFQTDGKVAMPLIVSAEAAFEVDAKSVSPWKVTALPTVHVPVVMRRVLAPMVKAAVPSGPEATTPESGLLLPPMARPPAVTFTPPAKVLAPESWSTPLPDLEMPPFWMTETMFSEGCSGASETPLAMCEPMTKAALAWPERSRMPLASEGSALGSMLVTVSPPESVVVPVRLRVAPAPLLRTVMEVKVFA